MRLVALALSILLFVCMSVPVAQAQASGTFVSGVGDDANPCSRTAPCQTFAGAFPKTAAGGEIRVLDNGDFGPVTITKSLTIIAVNSKAIVRSTGIQVAAGANDTVILRGLTIDLSISGQDHGIQFISGRSLIVQDTHIKGSVLDGILFAPTSTASLTLDSVQVEATGGAGLKVAPNPGPAYVTIVDSGLRSGTHGLNIEADSQVALFNSTITGSSVAGILASGSAAIVDVSGASISNSEIGVSVASQGVVRLVQATLAYNKVALVNTGGTIQSWGQLYLVGNDSDGTTSATGVSII